MESDVGGLWVRGLTRRYGGVAALEAVDLTALPGQVTALVGPNGAGKTTLVDCISGHTRPDGGRVGFRGRDLTGLPAHRLARLGLTRTFQNLRVFSGMSVLENAMVGLHAVTGAGFFSAMFRLPHGRAEERRTRELALAALELVGLADAADRDAETLAYGDQKRLELARALGPSLDSSLAGGPTCLLLDEPVAGLNAAETEAVGELIMTSDDPLRAIVLVEHDMSLVMRVSHSVAVLAGGRLVTQGPPGQVREDPEVIRTYLGGCEEFGLAV